MAFEIYLSAPNMGGNEIEYVKKAFETNWIAPYGPFLGEFEDKMSEYIGVESGLALSSGTAGIHLSLRYLGVGQGDTVFCSDLTFAGSCNPILYQNAEPIFIDCEPDSWNMSPIALKKAFEWAEKNHKMPKAIIIIDLYGESADYDKLIPICEKYNVPIIEDAAEAVGTVYKSKRCGSFGDISVLSFNGNKIITTSGGGMVLSNNKVAVEKMRFWSTQAKEPFLHYEHIEYGYNYRMSNISAGIGLGQLEFLDEKIRIRKEINERYCQGLSGLPIKIKKPTENGQANYWLSIMCLKTDKITPNEVITHLQNAKIEARPAWKPMHCQPIFRDNVSFSHLENGYVSEKLFNTSVCLPSGDRMTEGEQETVIKALGECLSI